MTLSAAAPRAGAEPTQKVNRYIGAQKCKTCHASKEAGDQFGALQKMKHAHAWEALASDTAKAQAKEKAIEDPQKADACVKCHVTAFGVPEKEIAKGFDKTIGVQCESCHGPGDLHMKARLAAAASEEPDAPKVYKGIPEGEMIVSPPMETCLACHNKESPNFKPFCFCKAKLEIRHLNPLRQRTDAEKAALAKCPCPEACDCHKDCCKDGKACAELGKAPK
jgi:hypothetical protein